MKKLIILSSEKKIAGGVVLFFSNFKHTVGFGVFKKFIFATASSYLHQLFELFINP